MQKSKCKIKVSLRDNYIKEKNKGFTLIEMLVTMFVFTLILEAAIAILISAIRLQEFNLAYFKITDQTSYVLEYMSRQIRMARRDDEGDCIGTNLRFRIQQTPPMETAGLMFRDSNDVCKGFFLSSDKRIKEYDSSRVGGDQILPLTPSDIEISCFGSSGSCFDLQGESATDAIQPRVTISMKVKGKNQGAQPVANVQTTVSARNLDF